MSAAFIGKVTVPHLKKKKHNNVNSRNSKKDRGMGPGHPVINTCGRSQDGGGGGGEIEGGGGG